MSYQATVFKVMIASPSDVAAERNVIREIITEWNNVNADARRTVLLIARLAGFSNPIPVLRSSARSSTAICKSS